MHLVIKKFLKKKQDILDTHSYVVLSFFYMYILHAMNTYIPDDLRRVSVSLLSWHRNTRMESAGNNIKRPNDDVALPVINTLRSRFLGATKALQVARIRCRWVYCIRICITYCVHNFINLGF